MGGIPQSPMSASTENSTSKWNRLQVATRWEVVRDTLTEEDPKRDRRKPRSCNRCSQGTLKYPNADRGEVTGRQFKQVNESVSINMNLLSACNLKVFQSWGPVVSLFTRVGCTCETKSSVRMQIFVRPRVIFLEIVICTM